MCHLLCFPHFQNKKAHCLSSTELDLTKHSKANSCCLIGHHSIAH
jgi:hypothetical protein